LPNASQTLARIFTDVAVEIGLSRPAGQCFSGIWRAAQSPCADDLVAMLGLSRSNVSTALKELRAWGLISIARTPGNRKEYFTAPADPWEVMRLVLAARQRQVIAPLLDRLLLAEAQVEDARIAALHAVMAQTSAAAAALTSQDATAFAKVIAGLSVRDEPTKKKKKKKA
jgi:DNA-binding transcriptional regulator GbsR (MarR family)